MFGLKTTEINEIRQIMKSHNVSKAIIYGSRVLETYKKGSDIDIAIIGDERHISYLLNEESSLPYYFDVVNIEKITNKNLLEHIRIFGKTVLPY